MKALIGISILLMALTPSLYAQTGSINNTLGSGGSFVIKDVSTTFLTLSQSDGKVSLSNILTLPVTTSSTIGVIFKGSDRFIHDFQASGADGNNTFVGVNAGNFSMSGSGSQASNNTAVGNSTLTSLTTGTSNSAVGYYALYNNTAGNANSAVGSYALALNSTGSFNSAVGREALFSNTTGGNNSAFGFSALYTNETGSNNSAVGPYALYNNWTGSYNSAVGRNALYNNSTGSYNSAVGYNALFSNSTGWGSSAFGNYSLYSTTGSFNTGVGDSAGRNLTTGSNNTLIGYNAQPSVATASNEITLGDGNIATLRCNASITSLSDARDKKNIKELPLGLDFLMSVKPRLFNWDRREWYADGKSDGTKMNENPTAGFIAQELDEVQTKAEVKWLNLVLKSNPDRLEATPGNLLPIMVKAIQELKAQNDDLRKEIATIRNLISEQAKITTKVSLNEN